MTTSHSTRSALLAGLAGLYAVVQLVAGRPPAGTTRLDPMAPALRAAELAMRDGRLDDALALAQTLRRTQPVDPFVSFLTATILEAQRRWPDAAVMWDE